MQRTQIILDDWQYEALKARATRLGVSMSELLRQILDAHLAKPPSRSHQLEAIIGIADDPATHGRDHDDHLYGKRRVR
jgi:hypothetical protein